MNQVNVATIESKAELALDWLNALYESKVEVYRLMSEPNADLLRSWGFIQDSIDEYYRIKSWAMPALYDAIGMIRHFQEGTE